MNEQKNRINALCKYLATEVFLFWGDATRKGTGNLTNAALKLHTHITASTSAAPRNI